MLTRIVQMTFKTENIASFERIFKASSERIRATKGCRHLELYRDMNHPNVFFTYSIWETGEDLENYRASDFFHQVWSETRKLFADKPRAWSLQKHAVL
ncbi:putative quinol monooxygenase [Robiginitalea sp. SC105]|uniref:putative quinol monooxygenase n=1 Tax=Robiginitalea sp. SC105 TaxID=2762332 RepID=UPI001639D246|nr:antibiotic biosynthesis monooxygenase [Robiginitalea sp. SC105]MBC2840359.1 antibiotic biosynthesis monooxygenase [Robiginitalea sp. SC105]